MKTIDALFFGRFLSGSASELKIQIEENLGGSIDWNQTITLDADADGIPTEAENFVRTLYRVVF